MNTQSRNLGVRLDAALTERLARFEQRTGVNGATLGRNAIEAALDYYDHHGKIIFPLHVIDDESQIALLADAEKGTGYNITPKKLRNAAERTAFYSVNRNTIIEKP